MVFSVDDDINKEEERNIEFRIAGIKKCSEKK